MNKIRLLCLFGGVSEEHEVSLSSARSVLSVLRRERYELLVVGVTREGKWLLYEGGAENLTPDSWQNHTAGEVIFSPARGQEGPLLLLEGGTVRRLPVDVVFPIMHGRNCEDGCLQGLFALSGVPFVGSGCLASALAMDKASTKMILKNHGIAQAAALAVDLSEYRRRPERVVMAASALGFPLFVKPSASGSSRGVSRVESPEGLAAALEEAFLYGRRVLIEEFVAGAEVELAVLGNDDPVVSVPGEIVPGSEFYDYDTKYRKDTASYYIPARVSPGAFATLQKTALKIYRILNCRGLARVDFFVEGERVIFNEINTLPGFTSISMYPKLMEAVGVPYPELIDRLLSLALEEGAGR